MKLNPKWPKPFSRLLLWAALLIPVEMWAGGVSPPEFPPVKAWSGRSVVATRTGEWQRFEVGRHGAENVLTLRESGDEGATWGEPRRCCDLPSGAWGGGAALIDRHGEVQLFFIRPREGGPGRKPAVDRFLDMWHLRSTGGRSAWSRPVPIHRGYIGAISGAIQLKSGRIVMPFGDWVAGRERQPPYGAIETTAVYSDDDGATFHLSTSRLVAPVADDYNGDRVGACEPAVVELDDGRVLMLLRTQTGRLYQSTSTDGIHWSPAAPSDLHASTGPAALAKLNDGRLLVVWNNCALPPKVEGQGVYAGRDALHAAVADGNATAWKGLREIYRDPTRNLEPPKRGDRGTAYPELLPARNGRIAVVAGQGGRRALLLLDPAWLDATEQSEDFSRGLEHWSVYTPFGPAGGWWRNRTQGAQLVAHPDEAGRRALHLRRVDEKDPDGATWNFPGGQQGVLELRVRLNQGCQGATIALTDRFFDPTDRTAESQAMAVVSLGLTAKSAQVVLPAERWQRLELQWDARGQSGTLKVEGRKVRDLQWSNSTRNGISYLRLRSTATETDLAGWLVDSVKVQVRTER